ncbi:putative acyltransferase [Corchorus capsularis]|uniref:Putative acyltransferase n=1 Tax=Corchorus capsularis TaxID=210143 RepID=A0A1R3I9J0_COCAP|nr:putative acyltransferase [Corchorus capsularis]
MEGDELNNFPRLIVLTVVSILYCYFIAAKIPKGFLRLLSVFPVVIILLLIPFSIYSFHIGVTAWVLLWVCGFKLLLFAFDQGPLSSSSSSSSSLFDFLCQAAFPFKIKENPPKSKSTLSKLVPSSILEASYKSALLALLFYSYNYKQYFPQHVLLILYFFHTYFVIQLLFNIGAIPAQVLGGAVEIEPQFEAPLLSTSLQNFWGRRWNRRSSDMFRATIYDPVKSLFKPIIGPRWSSLPAVFVTFVVSGFIHEVLYYHITRQFPTWEVTWFFVLQGILVDIEIFLKKKLVETNKFRLHSAVSRPLALAILALIAACLSFKQLLRNGIDDKIIGEFNMFVAYLKGTALQ